MRRKHNALLTVDVLTLFPGMLAGHMEESIIGKARERRLVDITTHNIRDYAEGKHKITDDRPYGGGPGMVMKPEPVYRAVKALKKRNTVVIMMTPDGEPFHQRTARELAGKKRLLFICGHYEGFDERIRGLADREISIGDYVLTNGALAAMVVIDAVARLVPGVVGDEESVRQDSFCGETLDWPQYTRPVEFRGQKVPEVLLSGHHTKIMAWRREQALMRTRERRKDLLSGDHITGKQKRGEAK